MTAGSEEFITSNVKDIIKRNKDKDVEFLIYELSFEEKEFLTLKF